METYKVVITQTKEYELLLTKNSIGEALKEAKRLFERGVGTYCRNEILETKYRIKDKEEH